MSFRENGRVYFLENKRRRRWKMRGIRKRFLVILIVTVLCLGLIACSAAAAKTLKYGHANVPIYFYHTAGVAFGEKLEELTDGALAVKVYPYGQLGGERDITEGLQLGTVDLQATSIGVTGTFVPALRILNLPFLFGGPKHWMKVMDSHVGAQILQKCREQGDKVGLKVLAIAAPDFRLPMNNIMPMTTLGDFEGLKIRTMEVPLHVKAYQAIGANPTPLPFGELYTALQTGVVDANENGPLTLYGMKFHEVQKYLTLLPVVSNGGIFVMSGKVWDKLPEDQQLAITKSISVWRKKMRADALEKGGWAINKMQEETGLEVNTLEDLTPFIEATEPVYDWLYNNLPADTADWAREMVQKIREIGDTIEEEEWYGISL